MKNPFKSLLYSSFVLLAASCSMEVEKGDTGNSNEDVSTITLNLETSGGYDIPSRTRALTNSKETAITNVYALVFDEGDILRYVLKGYNPSGKPDEDPVTPGGGGYGSFQFTMPESTVGETCNLVVIANENPGAMSGHIGISTYDEVQQALATTSITGKLYDAGDPIPMSGETLPFEISSTNSFKDLKLTRVVARIDVGVGAPTYTPGNESPWTWDGKKGTADIPFQLESVVLARPAMNYWPIPDPNKADDESSFHSSEGRISIDDSIDDFIYTDVENGHYLTQNIYTPESNVVNPLVASGFTQHNSRTAIIVGGKFDENNDGFGNDDTTWYRLDFTDASGLIDIVRNHLYQFNIDEVMGHGYDTPEEAYDAKQIKMSFNVLDWENGNVGNSDFEGQYFIDVDPVSLTFDENEGYQTLTVSTDHPDWEISSSDGWLTLDKSAGSGTQAVKVTAGKFTDVTNNERKTTIVIDAGPLTIKVPVTQTRLSVTIGSDVWRTGNVDMWGEVVPNEIEPGRLFQFGSSAIPRAVAWPGLRSPANVSASNPGYDSNGDHVDSFIFPAGSWENVGGWSSANNPCPPGFRVPTWDQWQNLLNNTTESPVMDSANNIIGRKFIGSDGSYIILPMTGFRYDTNGPINGLSGAGYESSTPSGTSIQHAYLRIFKDEAAGRYVGNVRNAGPVRCVKGDMVDPPKYSVTVNNNVAGGLAAATPTSAYASQKVTLSVSVSPDYFFAGWDFGGTAITPKPAPLTEPLTFAMPAGDVTATPDYLPKEVLVGGIRWSGVNVAEPGTFAATPVAYDGSDHLYTWDEAQTACPANWRLPTRDESTALIKANVPELTVGGNNQYGPFYYTTGEWTRGIKGISITATNGKLLFPLSGRVTQYGHQYTGERSSYWTSTEYSSSEAYDFNAEMSSKPLVASMSPAEKSVKMSVRCVQDVLPDAVRVGDVTWSAFNVAAGGKFSGASVLYDDPATRQHTWTTAKTVCPTGWTLATQNDYKALFAASTETWHENYNGSQMNGYEFDIAGEKLFFVASGLTSNNIGQYGFYWTANIDAAKPLTQAIDVFFSKTESPYDFVGTTDNKMSVRCVQHHYVDNPVGEVLVGGLIWAKTNVAAKGTFNGYEYIYDAKANMYTWDDITGGVSGQTVAGYCPQGWRLPTPQEYCELFSHANATNFVTAVAEDKDPNDAWNYYYDSNPGWATKNDGTHGNVNGTEVVTANGNLFFAASGDNIGTSGYSLRGSGGQYWSSVEEDPADPQFYDGYSMCMWDQGLYPADSYRADMGTPVRCVRDAQ